MMGENEIRSSDFESRQNWYKRFILLRVITIFTSVCYNQDIMGHWEISFWHKIQMAIILAIIHMYTFMFML